MSLLAAAKRLASEVEDASASWGRRIRVDAAGVLDRGDELGLARPGLWSANRSARMVRAANGWLAVNLPRADDREMLPALLERRIGGDPWRALVKDARRWDCAALRDRALLLGLPVSMVGEVAPGHPPVLVERKGKGRRSGPPKVIDLTSMWAGPLCAALLADAGAEVTRYESITRADPTRNAAPGFYRRLNGAKRCLAIDLHAPELADAIAEADILVTSARPRAFVGLGLAPEQVFERNPGLIWVAITGHGWAGEAGERIGFGDDAAAAGGLVRWTAGGAPRFVGDAVADPVTGMAAAAAAMREWVNGNGALVDVALARVASSCKPDN